MTFALAWDLAGPMGAWGEIAVGEVRDSTSQPSRSALVGLLMGALGCRRDDSDALDDLSSSWSFHVIQMSLGRPGVDYHTIETPEGKSARGFPTRHAELKYKNRGTMQTYRSFYTDCWFVVMVTQIPGTNPVRSLTDIETALHRPSFAPYLGRKAFPLALPMRPRRIEHAGDIEKSLRLAVSEATDHVSQLQIPWLQVSSGENRDRVVHSDVAWSPDAISSLRRDQPVHRGRWSFEARLDYRSVLKAEV